MQSQNESVPGSKKLLATVALLGAVVAISGVSIFYRISENDISATAAAFNRFWITFVILATSLTVKSIYKPRNLVSEIRQNLNLHDQAVQWALLASLSMGLTQIFWAKALVHSSVAIATVLHNTIPIFIALIACLFLRETFTNYYWISLGISLIGIIVLGSRDIQLTTLSLQGDTYAILSAICAALCILASEKAKQRMSVPWILLWMSLIGTILITYILVVQQTFFFPNSIEGWAGVISLAIICQIIGNGLLIFSLQYFSSGFVSICLLMDPISAGLTARGLFHERLSLNEWVVFSLIFSSITVCVLGSFFPNSTQEPSEYSLGSKLRT
ncbi:MAG: DMT family transporter [Cyanobacteria bacterium P01_H01_bin.121]